MFVALHLSYTYRTLTPSPSWCFQAPPRPLLKEKCNGLICFTCRKKVLLWEGVAITLYKHCPISLWDSWVWVYKKKNPWIMTQGGEIIRVQIFTTCGEDLWMCGCALKTFKLIVAFKLSFIFVLKSKIIQSIFIIPTILSKIMFVCFLRESEQSY